MRCCLGRLLGPQATDAVLRSGVYVRYGDRVRVVERCGSAEQCESERGDFVHMCVPRLAPDPQ
jgi:hypothetical protein